MIVKIERKCPFYLPKYCFTETINSRCQDRDTSSDAILQRRTWVTCPLVWRSWDVQRTTACSENLVNLSTSWRTWYKCPPPRTIKWTQPEAQMTPGLDLWLAPPPWFHLWSAPAWGNNNHDNRSILKWITMNCSFIDIILGSVSGMCNL